MAANRFSVLAVVVLVLVSGSVLYFYSTTTAGVPRQVVVLESPADASVFSSDSNNLFLLDGQMLRLWDIQRGRVVSEISLNHQPLKILLSPDEFSMAILYRDSDTVEIRDSIDWHNVKQINAEGEALDGTYSEDGRYLYLATTATTLPFKVSLEIWDLRDMVLVHSIRWDTSKRAFRLPVAISRNGEFLAIGITENDFSATVYVLSTASYSEVSQMSVHTSVLSLTWLNDPNRLAVGGHHSWLGVLDLREKRVIHVIDRYGQVSEIALSPNGCFLASGGLEQPTMLWNTENWQPAARFRDLSTLASVRNIDFSKDGRYIVLDESDRYIRTTDVWELPPSFYVSDSCSGD